MIIASDISPVANLILIRHSDVLQKLFSEIVVSSAVNAEILLMTQPQAVVEVFTPHFKRWKRERNKLYRHNN